MRKGLVWRVVVSSGRLCLTEMNGFATDQFYVLGSHRSISGPYFVNDPRFILAEHTLAL